MLFTIFFYFNSSFLTLLSGYNFPGFSNYFLYVSIHLHLFRKTQINNIITGISKIVNTKNTIKITVCVVI